jgi:hypothetical protein
MLILKVAPNIIITRIKTMCVAVVVSDKLSLWSFICLKSFLTVVSVVNGLVPDFPFFFI